MIPFQSHIEISCVWYQMKENKMPLTGFLLIFLTAGNLIAIGGYKMPGVWGQRPQRGPGAAPRRGPRGSAPGGVKGQSPLRGAGAAPLEAIRFSQSDKVKSTQPVMHK